MRKLYEEIRYPIKNAESMEEQSKVFKSADPSFLVRKKKIIKYVKISHPSLTHNDKFDKEGYTITLCFRSSALVRSMAVWWALDQKG